MHIHTHLWRAAAHIVHAYSHLASCSPPSTCILASGELEPTLHVHTHLWRAAAHTGKTGNTVKHRKNEKHGKHWKNWKHWKMDTKTKDTGRRPKRAPTHALKRAWALNGPRHRPFEAKAVSWCRLHDLGWISGPRLQAKAVLVFCKPRL